MSDTGQSARDVGNIAWMKSLKKKHPHDIADEIRDLPMAKVRSILMDLPDELSAEVIAECSAETQVLLFESMRLQRVSGIVTEMFSDDAVDVLGHLSAKRLEEVMGALPPETANEIRELLSYPEDTAGGIMGTEFTSVQEEWTIGEAIDRLRKDYEAQEDGLFYIYVIDQDHRLRGVLKLRDLIFKRRELRIRDVMVREVRCVSVHADQEEIARLFSDYHFFGLPVVDDYQRLCGVVTADDVMHVIEEEATEDMHRMVGLFGAEMVETPWLISVRNRLPWLFVNLATAFLAGWVVSLFEETIARYAVLAIFLPIIAGQGGNAGAQTLTILVRSLALGEVEVKQQGWVLFKEVLIGLFTGLATGLVVGVISWLWKGSVMLGVVTCLAMMMNMVVAAISGVLIPFGLKAVKVDPALASSIMLTTVTDVVGFFIFLGLAALGIYYFPGV